MRHAEFVADRAQQLQHRELGIEDVGHVAVRRNLLQKTAADGGLAGADFTREQHEAATGIEPVEQVRQSLAMAVAHEQVTRVGRNGKGLVLQPEKRGVHGVEDTARVNQCREGEKARFDPGNVRTGISRKMRANIIENP